MHNQEWRVLDGDGNEQGPYSFADLQSYYSSGNITHETMIWTEGLADWVPAGQVDGLLPDVPQIVPLAPAPTIAVESAPGTQPAVAGGMNLSPQIPTEKKKDAASPFISTFTILSGVAALVLFFFPWLSVSVDIDDTDGVNIVEFYSQTGIQSILQKASATEERNNFVAELNNVSVDEVRKRVEENGSAYQNLSRADLVLAAMICVALGVIIALIAFLNQMRIMTMIAQVLFVAGAFLIGSQMAIQFPMVKETNEEFNKPEIERSEAQKKEAAKKLETTKSRLAELKEKLNDPNEDQAKIVEQIEAIESIVAVQSEVKEEIDDVEIQKENIFAGSYKPSCFIAVILLGTSIFLVVITMSSGQTNTIIIPQPVGHLQGEPQQPQQPGGGLKFH